LKAYFILKIDWIIDFQPFTIQYTPGEYIEDTSRLFLCQGVVWNCYFW